MGKARMFEDGNCLLGWRLLVALLSCVLLCPRVNAQTKEGFSPKEISCSRDNFENQLNGKTDYEVVKVNIAAGKISKLKQVLTTQTLSVVKTSCPEIYCASVNVTIDKTLLQMAGKCKNIPSTEICTLTFDCTTDGKNAACEKYVQVVVATGENPDADCRKELNFMFMVAIPKPTTTVSTTMPTTTANAASSANRDDSKRTNAEPPGPPEGGRSPTRLPTSDSNDATGMTTTSGMDGKDSDKGGSGATKEGGDPLDGSTDDVTEGNKLLTPLILGWVFFGIALILLVAAIIVIVVLCIKLKKKKNVGPIAIKPPPLPPGGGGGQNSPPPMPDKYPSWRAKSKKSAKGNKKKQQRKGKFDEDTDNITFMPEPETVGKGEETQATETHKMDSTQGTTVTATGGTTGEKETQQSSRGAKDKSVTARD